MYGTMFAIVFPPHSFYPTALRQREIAGCRSFGSRKYNHRSSSVSKVFPTEKPMGSSRDILPRHTKSGNQPLSDQKTNFIVRIHPLQRKRKHPYSVLFDVISLIR